MINIGFKLSSKVEPPIPVYMNFHFFNVENGKGVRAGSKPNLTQYGPYAYKEVMRKENLTHGGANSLYYKKYMSYTFDPDKSAELGCYNGKNSPCSDNDTIMVLNPIVAIIGPILPELSDLICQKIPLIHDNIITFELCKTALNLFESSQVTEINNYLTEAHLDENPKDDLIMETTVAEFLFEVILFYNVY